MWALVLAAALAAENRPVAVVATSKRPGADAFTASMSERVQSALAREGVPGLVALEEGAAQLKAAGITDPRSCQAARSCVGRLALILGARGVVVSVDTAKAGNSLAVLLEAVSGDGPRVLASTELTLPVGNVTEQAALPIVLFARKLKATLEAEAPKEEPVVVERPVPVPDAPTKPVLEPRPQPTPLVVAAPASQGKKVAGWVFTGAAVAAAGTAVALAVLSASARGEFDSSVTTVGGERVSSLPQSRLAQLEGQANGCFYGALGTGGAAVGLGAVAAWLFLSEP